MSTGRLFRQQALDARSVQWLGTIRIAQPMADRHAALLGVLVIALIVGFAAFGSYTRRATVPGLLEPVGGTVRLTAPAPGTVLSAHVVEGQAVAAGDVLFVLSGERRSATGATQAGIGEQLSVRSGLLRRELALVGARHASRLRTTRERLAAIDVELARIAQEASINVARQRIADTNVERFEALARTGFIAVTQVQARVDEALVLSAQQAGLQRGAANLARERSGLASQLDESALQADAERADIERALASLEQEHRENEARRTTVVAAPHAAIVTGLAARPGQQVAPGALLATLIPEGAALEAELFATTRQVGFVERGQPVRLRYAAYPYQKFGMGTGLVASIEQSPYAPQELPPQIAATLGPAAAQGAEPVYRIVVAINAQTIATYGRAVQLKAGMVFEADVLQDRRRLFEWLLEPVYGLAGR